MKNLGLILCLFFLAGCASIQAKLDAMEAKKMAGAYVSPEISKPDADEAASDIAQFLSAQLPPAKTTLDLQLSKNTFHAALIDKLMNRGFGIVQSNSLAEHEDMVPLRYTVTTFGNGLLVELRYGGYVASRYLPRGNDGRLSLHNKYAVRGVSQ